MDSVEHNICVGLLLTGGYSTRFGSNKLLCPFGESNIISMTSQSLACTGITTYEAGAGLTSFAQIPDTIGGGPLFAIAKAYTYLLAAKAITDRTHILVLAGDIPMVKPSTLKRLAQWPTQDSVVPLINSEEQYLIARWSPASLAKACELVSQGVSRASAAIDATPTMKVTYDSLGLQTEIEFYDIDTKEDLGIISQFSLRNTDKGIPDDTGRN